MKNKLQLLIPLLGIIVLLSCGISQKVALKRLTVEKGAMPSNFGKKGEVMLFILAERKSFDKYLKKHVIENYFGEYEFVTAKQLGQEKYRDRDTYRYYFDHRKITSDVYNSQTASMTTKISTSCFIYDRRDDKRYEPDYKSGQFANLIKAYVRNLEMVRRLNQ